MFCVFDVQMQIVVVCEVCCYYVVGGFVGFEFLWYVWFGQCQWEEKEKEVEGDEVYVGVVIYELWSI